MVARRSPCRGRRRNAHHPPDDDDDDVEVVSLSVSARRSRLVSYPPSTDSSSVRCPPVRPHAARTDTNPVEKRRVWPNSRCLRVYFVNGVYSEGGIKNFQATALFISNAGALELELTATNKSSRFVINIIKAFYI